MARQLGLTAAVTLVGLGLFLNTAARFIPTEAVAHATPEPANAGPLPPTVVWYGATQDGALFHHVLYRAWSDGTVEARRVRTATCGTTSCWCEANGQPCVSPWFVIASPNEGLSAAADVSHDEQVDGADLAMLLGAWGPAPRNPTPPSDCPLELILPQ